MLSVSLERVGEKDFLEMLFSHRDSREAARVFLGWFRRKGGCCSKQEMSQFSYDLASGKLDARLSRTNFYKTILGTFTGLGLIAEDLTYDREAMKAVKAYRAVVQPVSERRPSGPSLVYLAHVVAERWNQEFFGAGGSS